MRRTVRALVLLFLFMFFSSSIYAQGEFYSIRSTELTVFRDGVILVRQRLSVNETIPSVTLTILTADAANLLVLDQRGIPLNYELLGSNLTIQSLGASQVTLVYETQSLTKKQGGVWTILFSAPYNVTAFLPEESTIIYLSNVPSEISVNGSRPVLVLQPGVWEISYILPLPTVTTSTTPPTTSPTGPLPPFFLSPQFVFGVAAAAAGLFAYALIRSGRLRIGRRAMLAEELRPEEREVMQFISERGGKVLEAELRSKFLLPKTSMWRMVRRLERRGLVRIKKIGLQNEIELVR